MRGELVLLSLPETSRFETSPRRAPRPRKPPATFPISKWSALSLIQEYGSTNGEHMQLFQ